MVLIRSALAKVFLISTYNICFYRERSTHNICFGEETRKICVYLLLSGVMYDITNLFFANVETSIIRVV